MRKILFALVIFPVVGWGQISKVDMTTVRQVLKNTGSAVGKEEALSGIINNHVDSQEKASVAMTAIMTSKTLYMLSLQNKDMFKMDSKNVTEIIRLCKGISVELVEVTKEVAKNPKSTIVSYNTIESLTMQTVQSLQYIYSLVSGGNLKISIPGLPAFSTSNNDGMNLLDAASRIEIMNRSIVNLRRIYNILMQIKVQLQYSTNWSDVFQKALPFDTYYVSASKDIANDIINQFR